MVDVEPSHDKTALITGADTEIGRALIRLLGASGEYRHIYLACHDPKRAKEEDDPRQNALCPDVARLLAMDTRDSVSVRRALTQVDTALDDVFLHAEWQDDATPMSLTSDGVTQLFAGHVLGHVMLLEGLIDRGLLKRCAVLSGSEAARGVPMLGIPAPRLRRSSVNELASICDGSYFDHLQFDPCVAYGQVKYVGALWLSALARRHPRFKLVTISPGNTRCGALPVHETTDAAARLAAGPHDVVLRSGHFYASHRDAVTGPLVEQSSMFPDLGNEWLQEYAFAAVHRFIRDA